MINMINIINRIGIKVYDSKVGIHIDIKVAVITKTNISILITIQTLILQKHCQCYPKDVQKLIKNQKPK